MGRLKILVAASVCLTLGCGRWGFGDRSSDRDDVEPGDDGVVTLSVITPGGPLQGIPIIFHNESGDVLGQAVTDVNGVAWGWVPSGGMVTIPDAGGNNYVDRARYFAARTIMGLEPGTEITIGSVIDPWSGGYSLSVSLSEEFLGADSYQVTAGCRSSSVSAWDSTMALDIGATCTREADDLTMVGRALDVDGNVLASSVLEGVSLDTTSVVMPAWSAASTVDATLALVGTPAYADDVDASLYSLYRGTAYDSASGSESSVGDAGAALALSLHEELVDGRRLRMTVDFDDPNDPDASDSVLYYHARQATTSPDMTVDFADMSLPIIRSVTVDTGGSRPSFYIDAEGNNFDDADHRFTVIQWLTAEDHEYEWMFMHPPGMGEFEMPEMPKEFDNYLVTADDEVTVLETAAIDYDFVEDYQDMVATYGFELFAWEFWLAPTGEWSWRASAGPGGFRRL